MILGYWQMQSCILILQGHSPSSEHKAWSGELMTESTKGNSYRWGVLNSARQSLPLPGQAAVVELQCKSKPLQLMLFAEPASQVGFFAVCNDEFQIDLIALLSW